MRRWALSFIVLAGCAVGKFIPVEEYQAPVVAPQKDYVIAPGDLINIRVFNQDQMSARERVRPDGKLSLPFLNDVTAAGLSPRVLGAQIQTRLKDFINTPVVTVAVEEPRGVPVSVAGEVLRPGLYSLQTGAGVLQALLVAGGLTEFGGKDRIFVLRSEEKGRGPVRIRFTYWALVRGEEPAANFQLRPGDTVVVE